MKAALAISPSAMALGNGAEDVDLLPPALRDLVHEFGWSVVRNFLDCGVTDPRRIRHLVHTVWLGPREPGNKRGVGKGTSGSLAALDDFLVRHEFPVVGRALIGLLHSMGFALIPNQPSAKTIAASCSALAGKPIVTYEQKHRIRLQAAILAAEAECWPFLVSK